MRFKPTAANLDDHAADVRVTSAMVEDTEVAVVVPHCWPEAAAAALARLTGAVDRYTHDVLSPDDEVPASLWRPADPQPCDDFDARRACGRVARHVAYWGWQLGLFDQAEDADAFLADLQALLEARALSPSVDVWAKAGLRRAYALADRSLNTAVGVDFRTGQAVRGADAPDFIAPLAMPVDDLNSDGNVVSLQRRNGGAGSVSAEAEPTVVTLNLAAFLNADRVLEPDRLRRAVHVAAVAAEIILASRLYRNADVAAATYNQRPLLVNVANLATVLMAHGLPYDSAGGRAFATAIMSLVTGGVAAASAEMAAEAGTCPSFAGARRGVLRQLSEQRSAGDAAIATLADVVRPALASDLAAVLAAAHAATWRRALGLGARSGFRNSTFTGVVALGPLAPLLDARSAGIDPVRDLVVQDQVTDERFVRMVAPALLDGLSALGYGPAALSGAVDHLVGHGTLRGAPALDPQQLRARGLSADGRQRLEAAIPETTTLRHIFNQWVLGRQECTENLGLDPVQIDDYGFDMLAALGFSDDEIEAADRYCCGHGSLAGCPGISAADAAALDGIPQDAADPASVHAMADMLDRVVSFPSLRPSRQGQPQNTEGGIRQPDLIEELLPVPRWAGNSA